MACWYRGNEEEGITLAIIIKSIEKHKMWPERLYNRATIQALSEGIDKISPDETSVKHQEE